jgi:hypothetical protein
VAVDRPHPDPLELGGARVLVFAHAGIFAGAAASWIANPDPRSPAMNTEKIRELVEQGRLLTSPMRARSARDIPVIRAALSTR